MAEYRNGQMSVEMAMGHSLQHIGKLYEAQTEAKARRVGQQSQINALEKHVNTLQAAVDRLLAFMEKVLRQSNKPNSSSQPKPDQP
jgi:hypothetical protein